MSYAFSGMGEGEKGEKGETGVFGGIIGGIGKIIEPLAMGGVMAYQTYATDRAQTRDVKARQAEAAQFAEIREREAGLAAQLAAQLAPVRAEQFKLVAGGVALLAAVGLAGYFVVKVGRKK
jgi:hypothetical protein